MIISTDQYMIRSKNANLIYWEPGIYPEWTALNCYRHFPNGAPGTGVEPHYHDGDELWLFTTGRGKVWLDNITSVVHNFEKFSSQGAWAPYSLAMVPGVGNSELGTRNCGIRTDSQILNPISQLQVSRSPWRPKNAGKAEKCEVLNL